MSSDAEKSGESPRLDGVKGRFAEIHFDLEKLPFLVSATTPVYRVRMMRHVVELIKH